MEVGIYDTNIKVDSTTSSIWFFIENRHINWEHETFKIFKHYLNKNNILIDIGAWNGMMTIYGAIHCKKVFSIEPDIESLKDFEKNLKINNIVNYELCTNPIFNKLCKLYFGPNECFASQTNPDILVLNTSTSQVRTYSCTKLDYLVDTITFDKFIDKYNINLDNVGLIKIDIEGGEEHIIENIFSYNYKIKPSIYLSFHYCWWNNKNLD